MNFITEDENCPINYSYRQGLYRKLAKSGRWYYKSETGSFDSWCDDWNNKQKNQGPLNSNYRTSGKIPGSYRARQNNQDFNETDRVYTTLVPEVYSSLEDIRIRLSAMEKQMEETNKQIESILNFTYKTFSVVNLEKNTADPGKTEDKIR